jgi:hypothetical protein
MRRLATILAMMFVVFAFARPAFATEADSIAAGAWELPADCARSRSAAAARVVGCEAELAIVATGTAPISVTGYGFALEVTGDGYDRAAGRKHADARRDRELLPARRIDLRARQLLPLLREPIGDRCDLRPRRWRWRLARASGGGTNATKQGGDTQIAVVSGTLMFD